MTFLFTDIEGSTRLWERNPVAMKAALARHDELLRAAIAAHDGQIFKYVGDAVFAVFGDPDDALAAALDGQRALSRASWPPATPIRVRMALHTGAAELLNSDYVGPTLNRCARLIDLAHGGQTLLSLDTRRRLTRDLPDGAELVDLAAHRLRDLAQPERVFQLDHPELPSDFPPLRSLDALPNNLPMRRSRFIGREAEMSEVRRLLDEASLVTLTGPAGCGKSRLALQIAADRAHRFADGVWLAGLSSLEEPELVPQRVANSLGLGEQPGRTVLETLVDYLRPRQMLLVLDDCDHLVDASATLAQHLLEASPDLKVLATSREALDIEAEVVWLVPPMSVPDAAREQGLEGITLVHYVRQFEAVQLFEARADAVTQGFEIASDNAHTVAELCRLLDGIPLAVELAAARTRVMTVAQILSRMGDRFQLLTDGRRDVPPHQQTLRALIDWSYDLLSERERTLFVRLSVFRGGWTIEAAEAICAGDPLPRSRLLHQLTALVAKSLVRVREQPDGLRYEFLHTILEYAWEKLLASPENVPLHERFSQWMLALAMRAGSSLDGPEQSTWVDRLTTERHNLRAALAWSTRRAAQTGDREAASTAHRLAAALVDYWAIRGNLREGRERLAHVIALPSDLVSPELRAPVLVGAALLAGQQGDYAEAEQYAEDGLAIFRDLDDRAGVASALDVLGQTAQLVGD